MDNEDWSKLGDDTNATFRQPPRSVTPSACWMELLRSRTGRDISGPVGSCNSSRWPGFGLDDERSMVSDASQAAGLP